MEVRDGFIVGIFNYCDRWCERCAFTSRCRWFADSAEIEASLDPNLKALVDAPPLPEEVPPVPPPWMQDLIEEANQGCEEPISPQEWERIRPRILPEHAPIVARAQDYSTRASHWLTMTDGAPAARESAREDISWFHFLIATKIGRALTTWPDDDPTDRTWPSDSDGSAKVALCGIDRSHAAWLDLMQRGMVPAGEAHLFMADLVWLGEALERARPQARAFVRPGFDEPDAVAGLLAGE